MSVKMWLDILLGVFLAVLFGALSLIFGIVVIGLCTSLDFTKALFTALYKFELINNEGEIAYTLIIGALTLGIFLYCCILQALKKNATIKEHYLFIREQLHEILTGILFLGGFLPVFVTTFVTTTASEDYQDIANSFLVWLGCITIPYLYSIFSKVAAINEEAIFKQWIKKELKQLAERVNK